MRLVISLAACLPFVCGCVMIDVGVTNPVVGLTTVAVAPFFNLSQEKAVDGRRFAMAYYTELQKTSGFQVIPVGVVEQVMFDNHLEMNNPEDVLRLSQLLNADAVVVGAVTDYSPYYPPRIGLQVSWYSPKPWTFYPGIPTDEFARKMAKPKRFTLHKPKHDEEAFCPPGTTTSVLPTASPAVVPRGQSPANDDEDDMNLDEGENLPGRARTVGLPEFLRFGAEGAARQLPSGANGSLQPRPDDPGAFPARPAVPSSESFPLPISEFPLPALPGQLLVQPNLPEFDPRLPLMSYTRLFDGTDPKLTARLRDYVELTGDLRAGGWQAYLHRSEDFIRFSSHVMIVEMLQLHGGEARKRVVFKLRKYR